MRSRSQTKPSCIDNGRHRCTFLSSVDEICKKQMDCIQGNCSRGRQWLGDSEGLGSFCHRCDSRTDHSVEERLLFYDRRATLSHFEHPLTPQDMRASLKRGRSWGNYQLRQHYDRASKKLHIVRLTTNRNRFDCVPLPKLWQFNRSQPTMP